MLQTFLWILNFSSSSPSALDKKREKATTFLPAPANERTGGSSDKERALLSISDLFIWEKIIFVQNSCDNTVVGCLTVTQSLSFLSEAPKQTEQGRYQPALLEIVGSGLHGETTFWKFRCYQGGTDCVQCSELVPGSTGYLTVVTEWNAPPGVVRIPFQTVFCKIPNVQCNDE